MSISADLPIIYSVACLLLGLGYAYLLYSTEKLLSISKLKHLLFIIRTLFIGCLAALLLNPIFKSLNKTIHKPIVILAQDISESIPDTSSFNFLSYISSQLPDFEVHKFSFSNDVNQGFSDKNKGLLTNFSNLFQDMNSRFANQHIAALVLSSDGLYNRGNNPLYEEMNYPVYTIAQGDTSLSKDVSITKIRKNDIAFLGNTFPLEVTINAQQYKGEVVDVNIWNKGEKVHAEKVAILSDDHYAKVKVNLLADAVGLQHYTITVAHFPEEKNIKNNNYTAYVDVIDSRYRILLLSDGAHPDIAAYKSTVEKNKNYAVEQISISEFNGNLELYQLVVLFGIKQGSSVLSALKESKIPLLIFNLQKTNNKLIKYILLLSIPKKLEKSNFIKMNKIIKKYPVTKVLRPSKKFAPFTIINTQKVTKK